MSEEVTHSSSVSLHRGAPCWEYNHHTFGVSDSLSYPTEAQLTLSNSRRFTCSRISKLSTKNGWNSSKEEIHFEMSLYLHPLASRLPDNNGSPTHYQKCLRCWLLITFMLNLFHREAFRCTKGEYKLAGLISAYTKKNKILESSSLFRDLVFLTSRPEAPAGQGLSCLSTQRVEMK